MDNISFNSSRRKPAVLPKRISCMVTITFFENNGKYGIKSKRENDVDGKIRIMMPIIYDNILLAGNGPSEESLTDKKMVGIKINKDGQILYDEFRFSYTPAVPGSCDNLAIIPIQENMTENDYESNAIVRKLI